MCVKVSVRVWVWVSVWSCVEYVKGSRDIGEWMCFVCKEGIRVCVEVT